MNNQCHYFTFHSKIFKLKMMINLPDVILIACDFGEWLSKWRIRKMQFQKARQCDTWCMWEGCRDKWVTWVTWNNSTKPLVWFWVLVYSQYDPYLIPVQKVKVKVKAEHMLEIQTEAKMVWVILYILYFKTSKVIWQERDWNLSNSLKIFSVAAVFIYARMRWMDQNTSFKY